MNWKISASTQAELQDIQFDWDQSKAWDLEIQKLIPFSRGKPKEMIKKKIKKEMVKKLSFYRCFYFYFLKEETS